MKYGLDDVAEGVEYSLCQNCHAQKMDPALECWNCPVSFCPEDENCVRKELYDRVMKRLKEIESEIDAELGGAHDEL